MDEDGDEDDDGGGHLLSICIPGTVLGLTVPILHMRQRLLRKVGKFAEF